MNGIWTSIGPPSPCCHLSVSHDTKGATMDHMSCCHLLANQATKGMPIKHCTRFFYIWLAMWLQLHADARVCARWALHGNERPPPTGPSQPCDLCSHSHRLADLRWAGSDHHGDKSGPTQERNASLRRPRPSVELTTMVIGTDHVCWASTVPRYAPPSICMRRTITRELVSSLHCPGIRPQQCHWRWANKPVAQPLFLGV
jgi:hypothetical protein